jgi:hypothetical protein
LKVKLREIVSLGYIFSNFIDSLVVTWDSNKTESTILQLNELCTSIKTAERQFTVSETTALQLEAAYHRLLRFLQENSAHQKQLEGELQTMVAEFRHARVRPPRLSIDALAFCMHSLRWPEVLLAMQREHREFFAPRQDDLPWRLMDAYSSDWSERYRYAYYAAPIQDRNAT